MAGNITVQSSIVIHKDIDSVFSYISDLRQDKNWRKEINETTLSTPGPALNSIATESSFLSKRVPDNKIKLQCVSYQSNNIIVHHSLPDERFSLMNSRQVEAMPDGQTRFIYEIAFDVNIVKHGLGFALPAFLVKYYTAQTMNKYLKKLKQVLEN